MKRIKTLLMCLCLGLSSCYRLPETKHALVQRHLRQCYGDVRVAVLENRYATSNEFVIGVTAMLLSTNSGPKAIRPLCNAIWFNNDARSWATPTPQSNEYQVAMVAQYEAAATNYLLAFTFRGDASLQRSIQEDGFTRVNLHSSEEAKANMVR
jgi:hypothetical protein